MISLWLYTTDRLKKINHAEPWHIHNAGTVLCKHTHILSWKIHLSLINKSQMKVILYIQKFLMTVLAWQTNTPTQRATHTHKYKWHICQNNSPWWRKHLDLVASIIHPLIHPSVCRKGLTDHNQFCSANYARDRVQQRVKWCRSVVKHHKRVQSLLTHRHTEIYSSI